MNKLLLFGFVSLIFIECLNAQVKIGSPGTPNTNAVLELDGGTSKGLLLPKLTNTEMIALNTAPDGLVVYNKTDNYLYLRKSAAWQKVSDATNGVGGLTLPYAGTASTLGGAEFSITHTTTFGDAAYFNNTAGGNAITSGSGNNKFNIVGGNTGIGIPAGLFESPKLGKLVVRGTVGAVSAMFGDNTSGVSIMNNLPSIGFNYYYNAGSKAISPGFGAALGQDPSNGRIYFSSSAASITGAGASMPLVDRLVILANGNVGIGTPAPSFPLDVNGRLRIRSNGAFNTAGIYYDKIYTAGQSSFVGTFNDSIFGIYGGGNWKFFFDHINNNLGINNSDPKAPLSFSSAVGNKIDFYYNSAVSRYGFGLQGSLLQMYSDGAGSDIAFGYGSSTSFTEKMRIKGNGNVGIGVTNPGSKLEISHAGSSNALSINHTGSGFSMFAQNSNASATSFIYNAGTGPSLITLGKVGINNTNPAFQLDVEGRMRLRNDPDGNSAGLWLDGPVTENRGFLGVLNENTIGLYGASAGWSFLMDVNDGAIMIGTAQKAAGYKVNVAGKIVAEEVRVQLKAAWPDYVFDDQYKKLSLYELEKYVAVNKHLLNIPSAADIEKDCQ